METSLRGQHIVGRCEYCGNERAERADPNINPAPFGFMPNCAGCGRYLDPDFDLIATLVRTWRSENGPTASGRKT